MVVVGERFDLFDTGKLWIAFWALLGVVIPLEALLALVALVVLLKRR